MRLPLWVLRWMHKQQLSRKKLRGGRLHGWFGDRILEKGLWLPTRNSLARAWLIGFPITVVPFLPGQTVFAIIGALVVRGNLLLCIALQFLSTPITAPVHLPACYFVGQVVRYFVGTGGAAPREVWREISHGSRHLLTGDAVTSLYLGSIIIGFLGGLAGYAILHKTWRDKPARATRPPIETGTRSPL
jgi:uncharacterized protein